jgi:hypothetical protein
VEVVEDLASELARRLRDDPKILHKNQAMFERCVAARVEDGLAWSEIMDVLRQFKIVRDWERKITKAAREMQGVPTIGGDPAPENPPVHDFWRDAPVSSDASAPPGWGYGDPRCAIFEIVEKYVDGAPVVKRMPASYDPIVITQRIQQKETGDILFELAWRTDRSWHSAIYERDTVFCTRKIVDCARQGLPVGTDNAMQVVKYLRAYEHHNLHCIGIGYVRSTMGWLGDEDDLGHHGFLCGNTQIGGNGQRIEFRGDGASEFSSKGTFEGWCAAMERSQRWPAVRIALCASLAAPLIGIVGAPNCAIELHGDTSGGKTSVLKQARSAWCSTKSKIPTWNTTINGIETRAQALNDLPFFVDDTAEVQESKRRDLLGAAIYMLESGHTRMRATKDLGQRPAKTWRTIVISTGEYSLADYVGTGGAAARVLSFWGAPYGAASEETGTEIAHVLGDLGKHYGHAGPMLVEWLCEHRDRWDEFAAQYQLLVSDVRKLFKSNAAMRLSETIALLELTARIVSSALGLPWLTILGDGTVCEMIEKAIGRSCAMSNKPKQAWQHMISIADARGDQWIPWGHLASERDPIGGWFGWRKARSSDPTAPADDPLVPNDPGRGDLLAWHPSQLRKILEDARFPVEPTLLSWRAQGIILSRDDRTTCSIRCAGRNNPTARVIVVRRNMTPWDDEEDRIKITESGQLVAGNYAHS